MIKKIVSGFQTGADIGAIKAAHDLGVETGGWMPKGYKTLDGPRPAYADLYGAQEHSSSNYAERTWDNILDSDGTIRIAADFNSPGEKCTLNGIKNHNKPYLDVDVSDWKWSLDNKKQILLHCGHIFGFTLSNKIEVLNIAGNSENTYSGIEAIVYEIITKLLRIDRAYHELD